MLTYFTALNCVGANKILSKYILKSRSVSKVNRQRYKGTRDCDVHYLISLIMCIVHWAVPAHCQVVSCCQLINREGQQNFFRVGGERGGTACK